MRRPPRRFQRSRSEGDKSSIPVLKPSGFHFTRHYLTLSNSIARYQTQSRKVGPNLVVSDHSTAYVVPSVGLLKKKVELFDLRRIVTPHRLLSCMMSMVYPWDHGMYHLTLESSGPSTHTDSRIADHIRLTLFLMSFLSRNSLRTTLIGSETLPIRYTPEPSLLRIPGRGFSHSVAPRMGTPGPK